MVLNGGYQVWFSQIKEVMKICNDFTYLTVTNYYTVVFVDNLLTLL